MKSCPRRQESFCHPDALPPRNGRSRRWILFKMPISSKDLVPRECSTIPSPVEQVKVPALPRGGPASVFPSMLRRPACPARFGFRPPMSWGQRGSQNPSGQASTPNGHRPNVHPPAVQATVDPSQPIAFFDIDRGGRRGRSSATDAADRFSIIPHRRSDPCCHRRSRSPTTLHRPEVVADSTTIPCVD